MPDPILNEQLILEVLQEPFQPATAEKLAHASILAVMDAYDRKITREAFVDLLDSAVNLNSMCVQTLLLSNILRKKAANTYKDADIDEGLKKIITMGDMHRDRLFMMADLVAQCPQEADTKH